MYRSAKVVETACFGYHDQLVDIAYLRHHVIAFRNPLFDGQLRGTIGHGTYGGAEVGECLAAAGRVIDGDRESCCAMPRTTISPRSARRSLISCATEKGYLRLTDDEGAGEHCISGNRALFHERVFDWLDVHVAR